MDLELTVLTVEWLCPNCTDVHRSTTCTPNAESVARVLGVFGIDVTDQSQGCESPDGSSVVYHKASPVQVTATVTRAEMTERFLLSFMGL